MERKKIKILVQDSLLIASKNIKAKFNTMHYEAHFFDTASEAINLLKKDDISLIVINNLNILKEIKQFYTNNTLSTIVILSDTSIVEHYIKEGATDFVNLSVLEEDLFPKIELSLYRSKQIQNLIDIANTDFLTNLSNKRYFYEKAQKIYQNNNNLAICMIDIDDFKMINDTYGHLAGDYAIKELSKILKRNIKGKDLVARFGGDEFCMLLQDISPQDASELIQNIQEMVKNHTFNIADKKINFTVSVGLTTDKKYSLQEMIHFADLNLFNSKNVQKPIRKLCTNCGICQASKKKEKEKEKII